MIITIANTQWNCMLATTYIEITTGLSKLESLPVGEGMLFDLGIDRSRIDINMDEMLFPLDIIFINSNLTVVGVLHNVNPGDEAYFLASNSLGARYFLEVNAEEAASVNVGDEVLGDIDFAPVPLLDTVFGYIILAVMMVMMVRITIRALGTTEKKPLLLSRRSSSTGNPGLVRYSRTYFTPELEAELDSIINGLVPFKQSKVNQLFEVMENINHTRKAIQEQRPPTPTLLEIELRTSFMRDCITRSDYNRFIDESVAIESYMNTGQWSDAMSNLNKLMFGVSDAFLVGFPEGTKNKIMDIVEALWRTR